MFSMDSMPSETDELFAEDGKEMSSASEIPSRNVKRYPLFAMRSTRLWIGILLSLGFSIMAAMRANLSITMVCMVNGTAYSTPQKGPALLEEAEDTCPQYATVMDAAKSGYRGEILWTPSIQSLLLSAYLYGSALFGPFAGVMSDKFGPKLIMLASALNFTLITVLTPLLANWSYVAFFIARFIMGIGEGFVAPALATASSRWFAPEEMSTSAALISSGNQIGSSIISVVASQLCASTLGWESVFYFLAPVGIAWMIVWCFIGSNSPGDNRWISDEEVEFLELSVPIVKKNSRPSSTPWKSILTSPPVYAAISAQTSYELVVGVMAALLPLFLKEYLRLPLDKNGFYTTLPFVTQLFAKFGLALIADYLKRNKIVSHTASAKIFQLINSLFSGLCLISLIVLPSCNTTYLAIPILAVYGVACASGVSGYYTSILSLAPAYAGTIFAISLSCGFLGSLCGIWMYGFLAVVIPERKWELLLVGSGSIQIFCGLFFLFFGSADIQVWAQKLPVIIDDTPANEEKKKNEY